MGNSIKGKPFFLPWQNMPISYDSILGISLTLSDKNIVKVFITNYSKTEDNLTCVIIGETNNGKSEAICTISTYLTNGVQVLTIPPNRLLASGTLTVVDTTHDETSNAYIQISPRYIHYINDYSMDDAVYVNDEKVLLNDLNIEIQENVANVFFSEKNNITVANVEFNTRSALVVDNVSNEGILSFAGNPVMYNELSKEYEGLLVLPDDFEATKINDNFALIRPYTYETCKTSLYAYANLGDINCNVSKSEDFPLPLDVCFEDDGTLNPPRIDAMEAVDSPRDKSKDARTILYTDLNNFH